MTIYISKKAFRIALIVTIGMVPELGTALARPLYFGGKVSVHYNNLAFPQDPSGVGPAPNRIIHAGPCFWGYYREKITTPDGLVRNIALPCH